MKELLSGFGYILTVLLHKGIVKHKSAVEFEVETENWRWQRQQWENKIISQEIGCVFLTGEWKLFDKRCI